MARIIRVTNDDTLLNYLVNSDIGYNRKKLKTLLKTECISVESIVTTQFDHPVKVGDQIVVKSFNETFGLEFAIIYEDDDIIVIDKPSDMLTESNNPYDFQTAFVHVGNYLKLKNPKASVYTVHRLDQATSGVLMFAKSEKVKDQYQLNWSEFAQNRIYIAVVEGVVERTERTIISYLNTETRALVYSSTTGKQAITHYKLIQKNKYTSILRVNIETGRQNQIRVHLKDIGHSIVGDRKYGAKTNPLKRMGLHAYKLEILHPVTKELQTFVAKVPKVFKLNRPID